MGLERPGLARVHVPHPIQDRMDAEMAEMARSSCSQILAALTG